MYAFYLYKQIKCGEDYIKKDLNQKREKLKTKLFNIKQISMYSQILFNLIFVFCPIKNSS